MNTNTKLRFSLTFLLIFAMLSPAAVLAIGDGKKHFRKGMDQEAAEAWDQAAEEFALAVSESPKNPEYRLHLQRALFMASQMYMKKGVAAANEKDYEGGYNAFRRAYAYDPTNELAKAEMERMVRLQRGDKTPADADSSGNVKLVQTSYKAQQPLPPKLQTLRDVPFPGGVDLQFIVKELAKDLDLNVLFDSGSRLDNRRVKIDLHNVSAAQALDYIFLQENLFFQKVGPRTIIVAEGNRRANFQQLVLRTFYLANADPAKIKPLIQQAIPAQPGRSQTIVMEDAATNSITIRDTEENIRLIGSLINSLDKDRAEVVMDVAIYEVNKGDLLQIGNQIGSGTELQNLGGTTRGVVGIGGSDRFGTLGRAAADVIPRIFGAGFVLPTANLMAFQSKGTTRLLASTQIHAFNNEDSSATIGQRVPVRTASIQTGNAVGSGAIAQDIINYEQTGLTLKFKPLVFPNQDVQVAMEIQSKDIAAGGTQENPIFTERTIKGTARVQNNKTLLLASVAQNNESNSRSGLPVLGLIPILGHLFTAPEKKNSQIDIVIAITPKVIRAPSVLPEDEIERPTGSQATPTNSSLVAMLIQDDADERLAEARRTPTNSAVQLPDQPATPQYVRTSSATQTDTQNSNSAANTTAGITDANNAMAVNTSTPVDTSILKPIDTSDKTIAINKTSDTSVQTPAIEVSPDRPRATLQPVDDLPAVTTAALKAGLRFGAEIPAMKKGEKTKVPIYVDASAPFRTATLGLMFDESKVAVRSVQYGDIYGSKFASTAALPYLNQEGKMFVSLATPGTAVDSSSGIIAYVEIEALADGKPVLSFDKDVLNILTSNGKNFVVSF
jgi:general secretion pathway protein D